MKVTVYLEIETTDYEGSVFIDEIRMLLADIDDGRSETRLTKFTMVGPKPDPRDFSWEETCPE